jgi:hypothetical protein
MYNWKWYNVQQSLYNREGYMRENAASYGVNIQQNIIKLFGPSLNT